MARSRRRNGNGPKGGAAARAGKPPELIAVLEAFDKVSAHYRVPGDERRKIARGLLEHLGVLKPEASADAPEIP